MLFDLTESDANLAMSSNSKIIGLMCLIGIFKANIGIFSLKFITFLVGSIAFGRIMSSLLLMNQDFFNTYFIFEIFAFIAGITLINLQKKLN